MGIPVGEDVAVEVEHEDWSVFCEARWDAFVLREKSGRRPMKGIQRGYSGGRCRLDEVSLAASSTGAARAPHMRRRCMSGTVRALWGLPETACTLQVL